MKHKKRESQMKAKERSNEQEEEQVCVSVMSTEMELASYQIYENIIRRSGIEGDTVHRARMSERIFYPQSYTVWEYGWGRSGRGWNVKRKGELESVGRCENITECLREREEL